MTERTLAVVLDELRIVEGYLRDVPPHSGGGLRHDLEEKAARLRREAAALRAPRDADGD